MLETTVLHNTNDSCRRLRLPISETSPEDISPSVDRDVSPNITPDNEYIPQSYCVGSKGFPPVDTAAEMHEGVVSEPTETGETETCCVNSVVPMRNIR